METGFADVYGRADGSITFKSKMKDDHEETAGVGIHSNSGFDKEGFDDEPPY